MASRGLPYVSSFLSHNTSSEEGWKTVRPMVPGAPPDFADLPRRAAELVAAQFDTVAAVAEGCAGGGRHDAGRGEL